MHRRPELMTGAPAFGLAEVIAAERSRYHPEFIVLTVQCPNGCRRPHTHGVRDDFDADEWIFGHRAAHCRTANRGYILVDPAGLVQRASSDWRCA